MKSTSLIFVLVLLVAFALPLVAQEKMMDVTVEVDDDSPGQKKILIKKMVGDDLDLTDDQKVKVKDLKLFHEKELLLLQNDLRVKKLDLKIATKNPDKVDLGKVNAIVDEIHKLNAGVQKKKIAHQSKFRSLLSDEQKKKYDVCCGDAGCGMGENVHIFRHKMHGTGGDDLMWFGDGDETIDMLHDFDIDVDEHYGEKVKKRIEIKRKL